MNLINNKFKLYIRYILARDSETHILRRYLQRKSLSTHTLSFIQYLQRKYVNHELRQSSETKIICKVRPTKRVIWKVTRLMLLHGKSFEWKLCYRHTTLSGTPGGGNGRFLGGGPRRCDLLSNRHSPIFPYVSSPWSLRRFSTSQIRTGWVLPKDREEAARWLRNKMNRKEQKKDHTFML